MEELSIEKRAAEIAADIPPNPITQNEGIPYEDRTDETADERIEKLLNFFGQTISDLPKPHKVEMGKSCYAYSATHLFNVGKAIESWEPFESGMPNGMIIGRYKDYICHLCDVIDRMETALEKAKSFLSDGCVFKVSGITEEDIEKIKEELYDRKGSDGRN